MPKQYLIAFSGTHGTGKSTTIKNLVSSRDDMFEDPLKVSRKVQTLLGYEKLEEAYKTPKRMIEFQELILEQKIIGDNGVVRLTNKPIILTERSYLDIAAYALQWSLRVIEKCRLTAMGTQQITDWYLQYEKRCLNEMKRYDGLVFVYPLTLIEFEAENNRADLKSRDFIHSRISDYVSRLEIPITILEIDSVHTRIVRCNNFITNLIGK